MVTFTRVFTVFAYVLSVPIVIALPSLLYPSSKGLDNSSARFPSDPDGGWEYEKSRAFDSRK